METFKETIKKVIAGILGLSIGVILVYFVVGVVPQPFKYMGEQISPSFMESISMEEQQQSTAIVDYALTDSTGGVYEVRISVSDEGSNYVHIDSLEGGDILKIPKGTELEYYASDSTIKTIVVDTATGDTHNVYFKQRLF